MMYVVMRLTFWSVGYIFTKYGTYNFVLFPGHHWTVQQVRYTRWYHPQQIEQPHPRYPQLNPVGLEQRPQRPRPPPYSQPLHRYQPPLALLRLLHLSNHNNSNNHSGTLTLKQNRILQIGDCPSIKKTWQI